MGPPSLEKWSSPWTIYSSSSLSLSFLLLVLQPGFPPALLHIWARLPAFA